MARQHCSSPCQLDGYYYNAGEPFFVLTHHAGHDATGHNECETN